MFLLAKRRLLFWLLTIGLDLFLPNLALPVLQTTSFASQVNDSIFNQIMKEQPLLIHENGGVVFTRVGNYFDVEDVFALSVTVPITQYLCNLLPLETTRKLSMCIQYESLVLEKLSVDNIPRHSMLSEYLNATNMSHINSAHFSPHIHRSKRFIPLIVGAIGALGSLVAGGISVYNTIKGAELSAQCDQLQARLSATITDLQQTQVSLFTLTNTTLALAKRFDDQAENLNRLKEVVSNIVERTDRHDSIAEAQMRYNIKTHIEHVYDRIKNAMHRIEKNDLNFEYLGLSEQTELIEMAFQRLKGAVPSLKESKATFVTRMLFAQTVQFQETNITVHMNSTADFFPEYLGNLIFTNYFSILKTKEKANMQVYTVTTIPLYHENSKEKVSGSELYNLPKKIALAVDGSYIEWRETREIAACDFGDYTVCREPPLTHIRIINRCLEQLVVSKHSHNCFSHATSYQSPYVTRIIPGVIILSTGTIINCAINNRQFQKFSGVSIVNLGCRDGIVCDSGLSYSGDRRCETIKPYVLKTSDNNLIPIVETVRPLNVTLYPFVNDKDLVLSLEEQLTEQQQQKKDELQKLLEEGKWSIGRLRLSPITAVASTVSFALIIVIAIIFVVLYCYWKGSGKNHPGSVMHYTNVQPPPTSTTVKIQSRDRMESDSLLDLLKEFQKSKK